MWCFHVLPPFVLPFASRFARKEQKFLRTLSSTLRTFREHTICVPQGILVYTDVLDMLEAIGVET